MNEQKMDDLISGLTRGSQQGSQKSATENNGNPNNSSNTDNTDYSSKSKNPDKGSNTNNTSMGGNTKQSCKPDSTRHTDNTDPDTDKEVRFCTIVDAKILHKIRVVANREGLLIKDVVGAAFSKAIASYESKHGPIVGDLKGRADSLF